MLRISRLADYGLVIASHLKSNELVTLGELTARSHLALPTVRKIMRILTNANLIESVRGASGGYQLARPLEEISLGDIIEAIDGPIAVTDCVKPINNQCILTNNCSLRTNWNTVNRLVADMLHSVSINEMRKTPRSFAAVAVIGVRKPAKKSRAPRKPAPNLQSDQRHV